MEKFDLSEFVKNNDQNIFQLLFSNKKETVSLVKPIIINSSVMALCLNHSSKKAVIVYLDVSNLSEIGVLNVVHCDFEVHNLLHAPRQGDDIFFIVSEKKVYKAMANAEYLQEHFTCGKKGTITHASITQQCIYMILDDNKLIRLSTVG